MTSTNERHTTAAISIADLNTEIDNEPRVLDVVLGERLGMAQPRNLRTKIKDNLPELKSYGEVCTETVQTPNSLGFLGGRPGKAYYLNEPQALLICMFSNTARAAEVRKMLIDVFMEYRRSKEKPIKVQAHERRTSTHIDKAMSLARSAERLEAVAATLAPRQQVLSATIVDGQPVVFDPHDASFKEGDVAIGFDWDGNVMVSPVSNQDRDPNDSYRPGGVRLVYGMPRRENGITRRAAFFAIGKVVMPEVPTPSVPTIEALPSHYRGRKTLYRDDILRLIAEGKPNREIAQITGACYQTVTHWRRWSEDRSALAA